MCECGRRAGATAFWELHSQLPEVQIVLGRSKGGTWTLAQLLLGAAHFCLTPLLTLKLLVVPSREQGCGCRNPSASGEMRVWGISPQTEA